MSLLAIRGLVAASFLLFVLGRPTRSVAQLQSLQVATEPSPPAAGDRAPPSVERRKILLHIDADTPISLRRNVFLPEAHAPGLRDRGIVCTSPCDQEVEFVWPGSNFELEGDLVRDTYVSFHWTGARPTLEVRAGNRDQYVAGLVLHLAGAGLVIGSGVTALGVAIHDSIANEGLGPHAQRQDSFAGPLTPTLVTLALTGVLSLAVGVPLWVSAESQVTIIDGPERFELTGDGFALRF